MEKAKAKWRESRVLAQVSGFKNTQLLPQRGKSGVLSSYFA
jgi:hypothetical protein